MSPADIDRTDPEGTIAKAVARVSNWGRWGEDDVRGTMNFLTDDKRREAAALVRTGQSISLSLPFDMDGPQNGWRRRTNPCTRCSTAAPTPSPACRGSRTGSAAPTT